MRVVIDASVALKWMFRHRDGEEDVAAALDVLQGVHDERLTMMQPPHFIAEVSAVLAREMGAGAEVRLRQLLTIDMETVRGRQVYERAIELSRRLSHHLFDTLYHAVALDSPGTVLLTADERYHRAARNEGGVVRLRDFRIPPVTS